MASLRVDVAWCPAHPDRFLLVGGDLRLYEVAAGDAPTREAGRDVLPGAALLSTCADFQFLRCFSCYLNPNCQLLLAVGQDDGKVSLAGFGRSFNDTDWVGKEFAPKQPRRCNVVAWNPVEFSLLAAGLDKHKGDHCILVWDLNHLPGQTELDSSRSSGTTTKASGGVCVDPFSEHRIASFHANQLVLWDVRNFEKPVTTQTENGQIVKIAWSPTRSHLMGVLTRDSGVVKLYDVQQSPAEDLEPTLVERSVQPYPGAVLSSFCWHPQHENRMLAVTPDGAARDYTVLDRITLNWSPSCELIWMRGKKLAHCWGDRDRGYDCLDDTASANGHRRRPLSQPEDLWRNAELCDGDGHLRGIWSWLEHILACRSVWAPFGGPSEDPQSLRQTGIVGMCRRANHIGRAGIEVRKPPEDRIRRRFPFRVLSARHMDGRIDRSDSPNAAPNRRTRQFETHASDLAYDTTIRSAPPRRSKHSSGAKLGRSSFSLARAFFAGAIFFEWVNGIHASGFPSPTQYVIMTFALAVLSLAGHFRQSVRRAKLSGTLDARRIADPTSEAPKFFGSGSHAAGSDVGSDEFFAHVSRALPMFPFHGGTPSAVFLLDRGPLVRSLEESGMRGRRGECAGVRALLGPDPSSLEGPSRGPLGPTYHSRERERVLWLCGWKAKHDGLPGNIFHRRLEKEANYARKAAIHMFNLRLKEAVAVLRDAATTGKGSSVGLVALALSGYSKETREAWREVWHSLRLSLSEPYLHALFAFLTAQDDSYHQLLYDCDMAVEDRVAFACLHLPDSKLTQYIGDLTNSLVAEGNLDGVLLTGLGEEGVELVQRYLDRTGDVQTASLVALQSHPSVLSVSPRAQLWVDHYRHLLDQWRLWQQRCQFDCQWVRQHASSVPPPQVVVSCNFCGLAATPYLPLGVQGRAPPRPHLGAPTLNKTKVSCCPSCRKPLPRCALCLTNMGTPAGSLWKKGDGDWPPRDSEGRPDPAEEEKLSGLSTWFTWCQSCRHGGHAVHLADWFGDHTECPVTGCSCKCGAMDRID
ncbi:hypothetical protein HPB47_007546 [Ixodes persulcatus]|uniref:Uncharacterized protein n=1 Tax=Ixodes persulcatus TaxID=34615 RepID=A0AC60P756_IXOPE|nr:hypothetical protein HPB47_007546 [Ixodes persulcatus]